MPLRFTDDAGVLARFAVAGEALLGFGGESRVYALDDERVLRVYEPGADRAYVERLRAFYDGLHEHDLPFEVPEVLELDEVDGRLYAIERRIAGDRLSNFLKTADGEARTRALVSYVEISERIQGIPVKVDEFGEVLSSKPMRRASWPEYLRDRAHDSVARCKSDLAADVPGIDDVIAAWERDVEMVADIAEPKLAHGDYFPGNVMANERGEVTAVIDFSPMTVAGDPRLDVLCALIFIEVDEGYRADDSAALRRIVEERHAPKILELESVYRTYYSLYFSPVKASDGRLYAWCVKNLRAASAS